MKKIYFGIGAGFDRDGKAIAESELQQLCDTAIEHVAKNYGGCTVLPTRGGWIDPSRKVVIENGIGIEVLADVDNPTLNQSTAKFLRDTFRQQCVVLSVQDIDYTFV